MPQTGFSTAKIVNSYENITSIKTTGGHRNKISVSLPIIYKKVCLNITIYRPYIQNSNNNIYIRI